VCGYVCGCGCACDLRSTLATLSTHSVHKLECVGACVWGCMENRSWMYGCVCVCVFCMCGCVIRAVGEAGCYRVWDVHSTT
jgi:hypothetical protein